MEEWIKIAEKLPVGHSVRYRHCGKDEAASIFHNADGYSLFCHRCGTSLFESFGYRNYKELLKVKKRNEEAQVALQTTKVKLPFDFTLDIPPEGMLWLLKASITPHMARVAGFGWTPYFQRVVLPVYNDDHKLIYYQARAVLKGQDPKYLNPKVDRSAIIYWRRHKSTNIKRVVVTEDILSAERIFLAQDHADTACILGTKITQQQANQLAAYDEVTTWLDSDKAGVNGSRKVRKLVGLAVRTSNIVTLKDPKLLSAEEIRTILRNYLCSKH